MFNTPDRRRFLKGTAIVGGAGLIAAAGYVVGGEQASRSRVGVNPTLEPLRQPDAPVAAVPTEPVVNVLSEHLVKTDYFTITGAAESVNRNELKIAGVHPDARTHTNEIGLNTDMMVAEPGSRTLDYVSPDPVQAKIDVEQINAGAAVFTANVRRDMSHEGYPAELFEDGMTMITTGYGTFTVKDSEQNTVMSVELPKAKKRGYILFFRGRTDGGPDDDLNTSIEATNHNKPYTDAYILPTKQQFASEKQLKQNLQGVFGNTPQGTNCGDLKGCTEAVVVMVDITRKAFTGVKTTDGVNYQQIATNIV